MLKKILAVVAVLVIALVVFVGSRPSAYKVERTHIVNAPAEVVFAQVADFQKWGAWSPWAKLDPNMKTTFEGTAGAVDSSYAWEGHDKVGTGKMTILEATPSTSLKIKLEFLKPQQWTSETVFTFAPVEKGTTTTWTMSGNHDFFGKAFALFGDMDKMIGTDFETGLAQLDTAAAAEAKKIAEAAVAQAAAATAEAAPAPEPIPAAAPGMADLRKAVDAEGNLAGKAKK
jgi:hypothetical protein